MLRLSILILLAVSFAVAANEVYRWVDEDGVMHYSDRPHEGAETVTLPEAQTYKAPPALPERPSLDRSGKGDEKATVGYDSVQIISPKPDEVLWGTGGKVQVSVNVQPILRRGDTLMIYLDNRMTAGLTGNQRETELENVFRGEHTLRVEIRNGRGDVVAKGNSVPFTVKQQSIQNPSNPNLQAPITNPGG